MSTYATVEYEWGGNYKSYWPSDGNPNVVLEEEILPMIEVYAKDKEEFYREFLDLQLIPIDEYIEFQDYEYHVKRFNRSDKIAFTVEIRHGRDEDLKINIFLDEKTAIFDEMKYDIEELNEIAKTLRNAGYRVISPV